jgi:hypothetical protein
MPCCLVSCLLLASAVCAEEAPPLKWAIGWDDGVELRRQLTPDWDLFLGAGPDDRRSETDEWAYQEESGESAVSGYAGPSDNRTESGWVSVGVGRCLFAEDALRVAAFCRGYYTWEHASYDSRSYSTYDGGTGRSLDESDREDYVLSLGLRPTYRLGRRLTVEARISLRYSWYWARNINQDWRADATGAPIDYRRTVRETAGGSFNDTGFTNLSSLKFFFWF